MIANRVEKHVIKENDKYYPMLCDFMHKSKNLYNHANYIVRNEFVKNGKWIRYFDLCKMLRADEEYDDFRQMPCSASAQETLRVLDQNWKSFFRAIKEWSKNKEKFKGRPKLPGYKPKDGYFNLMLTYVACRLKDNILVFPKTFNGLTIKPQFVEKDNFVSFQQVRFLPRYKHIVVELVYRVNIPDTKLSDNGRYLGVDIGIDNLATVVNNFGAEPIVIDGRSLKSINQFYNKKISHYRGVAKRMNDMNYTRRMGRLTNKRNAKINDYMHKASLKLINYALENGANTIVIGYNKGWKQESELSKQVNQFFVGIPSQRFIEMVQYKAENVGLNVVLTEESYTSGTSFLDEEDPVKENYDKSRRIYRGLFMSNNGIKINADVNGAYQIMKKAFPDAFAKGIEGAWLHPVRVNVL